MTHAPAVPVAIDPPYCGCVDCITGYSVPLDQAVPAQLAALLNGTMANRLNSHTDLCLDLTCAVSRGSVPVIRSARVSYHNGGDMDDRLSWDLSPADLGANWQGSA
ncbi:hypothetical protein ACIG3E_33730 [Streptomyces sp. NPDC053474]|uniref:hypothetical protein n=1 Tax=Streptomyces sp. NPDC053474 TaxID=3365704 RepID=UPI0037D31AE2